MVICDSMNTLKKYSSIAILVLLSCIWLFWDFQNNVEYTPQNIKVALREVGHTILLANNDSLSLVLPVEQIDGSKYALTFEKDISLQPDSLVALFKKGFNRANLPKHYIVEVIQCTDGAIAYSYKMRNEKEKSIVPCGSRTLPKGCYRIETQFLNQENKMFKMNMLLYVTALLIAFIFWDIFKYLKSSKQHRKENTGQPIALGNYVFFPNQNKLALKRKEILLSKKEGELLFILASNLNLVVKREDLVKKVWEDNGVVVGRSLDTYISKLRKRLQEDKAIKLTNIHGVGYKLEV